MTEDVIQWDPAFATALKLELEDYYPSVIDIQEEFQLTTKPLEVDILVIKKLKDVEILKNIAQIFKEHNIVEYKSPQDYISLDDYYKVKAYAYLYKALADTTDGIKIDSITITMVSSSFPKKMAKHIIETQKVDIQMCSEGIYYIVNDDIASQIIVIDELPKKENRYVRLLTRRMNIKDEISQLLNDYVKNPKDNRYEYLMELVYDINITQVAEVLEMAKVLTIEEQAAIDRVIKKFNFDKKWYDEGKAEGEAKGKAEGSKATLVRLLNKKIGEIPYELEHRLEAITDSEIINSIIDSIFEIKSLENVKEILERYGM